MSISVLSAVVNQFKVVPEAECTAQRSVTDGVLRGFIVLDGNNLPVGLSDDAFCAVDTAFGTDVKRFNMTFHKSFGTVDNMSPEEYYAHQIVHYFTTYGAALLGLDLPTYIPDERLDLPNGIDLSKLVVLRAVSEKEMQQLINEWFVSVVSPSKDQVICALAMMPYVLVDQDAIKSFELQCLYCAKRDIVPQTPTSFLRYLIYKATGETLIINNRFTRRLVFKADAETIRGLFEKADLNRLSSIFLRNKDLFLMFKKLDGCAPYINKLRRLAEKNHKPLPRECVQNAVAIIGEGDVEAFGRIVKKASNRELVKIGNAILLKLSRKPDEPEIYSIRNGRTFVNMEADAKPARKPALEIARSIVVGEIVSRLRELYEGKTFVIPAYIDYAAPVTEKQFVGNYPYGTTVCPGSDAEAITVGIHWFNHESATNKTDADDDDYWYDRPGRVDLDLHLNSVTEHYGWNGGYRSSGENSVIYTGDMTDAPRPDGAAEAYYLALNDEMFALSLCQYCGRSPVDFKLFFSGVKPEKNAALERNYTFNPQEQLIPPLALSISERSMNLGVIDGNGFTFFGGAVGSSVVPSAVQADFVRGIKPMIRNRLMLADLLFAAGANVVSEPPAGDDAPEYVDLSPEKLTRGTLMGLIDGPVNKG